MSDEFSADQYFLADPGAPVEPPLVAAGYLTRATLDAAIARIGEPPMMRIDPVAALVEQAYRVAEADRVAGWERIRRDADVIAEHLTETLLPEDLRAAGMRFEWTEQG